MLQSVVHFLLWLLSKSMAFFHLPMWLYYRMQSPKRCPPVFDDLFFMPATILAEKIRQQEMTSTYIVSMYINRAKEVNQVLNAVVQDRYELAMLEAQHADEFVKSSGLTGDELQDKYPLLGVPLTVKECIAVADMSFAAGSYINQKTTAERDATVVKLLKAAGAIIYLVSNTPELCMNWETFNYVTGRTLNPYDTRRSCGGSSGGESVLLASCGSLIGVGSDCVGSARAAPSFCGVYGHRTSGDLTPTDLHIPYVDHHALSICPITRYAIDLPLLLKCMIPHETAKQIKLLEPIEPKTIRVYYKFNSGSNYPTTKVDRQIKNAMKKVIAHLEQDGFYTKHVDLIAFKDQFDIAFINLLGVKGVYEAFSYSNISVFKEIMRTIFCCPRIILSVLFFEIVYGCYKLLSNEKLLERNRKLLDEMKADIEEMLGEDGVLLYPTSPSVAHVHGKVYAKTIDTCYMAIFNALDLPSTVVPIGKNSDGLPIGIQIVSKQKNDRLSLAMARHMEISFGGWLPPPYSSS